ncbi:MAG: IspD/TarI family cytidylyltransferase [Eubacterium sp.]|jgi:2-C-methyl-D-erythritol 4-phosphate cytidylyltransferase
MGKSNVYAAILAGGTGTRMKNAGFPKQFICLGGIPILILSLEKFAAIDDFDLIAVVCPPEYVEYTEQITARYMPNEGRIAVAAGGPDRNSSLMNALDLIDKKCGIDDESIVVTHDAVRPFVTDRIIRENIQAAREFGACATCIPSTDTIFESEDGAMISSIPDRAHLYQAQTPQSFYAAKLRALYRSLKPEERVKLTDAAKIFTLRGEHVAMVRGETYNMKITYPHDIEVAAGLAKAEAKGAIE